MKIPHKLPGSEQTHATDGKPGKTPADKITIIGQRYAGFFTGRQYRFDQQSVYRTTTIDNQGIHIGKIWKEPLVTSDDCDFCKHTTDERAVERVAGYQHQIDIEILRASKNNYYDAWLIECGPEVIEREWVKDIAVDAGKREIGKKDSAFNRRRFIELFQDAPRQTRTGQDRPDGWKQKALPLVNLPLRLKRKMCIEWNHVYRDYLKANPSVTYDFETRIFLKEMPELGPLNCCGGVQVWNQYEKITELHKESCLIDVERKKEQAEHSENIPGGYWFGGFH